MMQQPTWSTSPSEWYKRRPELHSTNAWLSDFRMCSYLHAVSVLRCWMDCIFLNAFHNSIWCQANEQNQHKAVWHFAGPSSCDNPWKFERSGFITYRCEKYLYIDLALRKVPTVLCFLDWVMWALRQHCIQVDPLQPIQIHSNLLIWFLWSPGEHFWSEIQSKNCKSIAESWEVWLQNSRIQGQKKYR